MILECFYPVLCSNPYNHNNLHFSILFCTYVYYTDVVPLCLLVVTLVFINIRANCILKFYYYMFFLFIVDYYWGSFI